MKRQVRKLARDKFVSYHRGNVYSKLGKSKLALRYYDDAIQIDKAFAEAYNDKAAELSKLARYDEARNALQMAIKIKPDFVTAHENLIKITLREQSFPTFLGLLENSKIEKLAGSNFFVFIVLLDYVSI